MRQDLDRVRRWLFDEAVYEPHFAARDKRDALRKMARVLLGRRGYSTDIIEQVANALYKREMLASTGIGRGMATPHTKFPVSEIAAGWFRLDEPMDFDSIGDPPEPVFIILCVVSPVDRPGDHLRTMEMGSRMLRDDALLRLDPEQFNVETMKKLAPEC